MQRRSQGVLESIQDLLTSKMGGQLKNGDTIGLWTYNEELSAGKLPVQQWSEDKQQRVTALILSFLKEQKYEKQGRFEKILPPLGHLIKNSSVITVILISDGTQEIHGTTFDDRINSVFKLWRTQQQESRMPFVTILRGVGGNVTDYAVNPAPWTVALPPLPPEPPVAKAVQKQNIPASQRPSASPAPSLPPLILSGRKPEPSGAPKNIPPTSSLAAAPDSASVSVQAPPPTIQAQAAPVSSLPSAPAPTTAAAGSSEATRNEQRPAAPQNEPGKSGSAPPGSDLVAKSNQPAAPPSSADSQSIVISAAGTNGLHAQVATVDSRTSGSMLIFVVSAVVVGIVIAGGIVWFWRNRPKTAQPESLITQSLDRRRK